MCSNCNLQLDATQSDAFAERLVGILNDGALGLMISLGYRTRLFDVMETLEPSTSQQIADASRLNERYVREWLGAMVTGKIVMYDPATGTYRLPTEHAAWLTRRNAPNNVAVTAQWLTMIGQVEDRIVESFENGGGLQYKEYNRFNEVMADESYQTVVTPLVENLLPLVPGLIEKLERGISVLDVGCGRGKAMLALAERFPNSRFTGYDFLEDPVRAAEDEAAARGLSNIAFMARDAAAIDETERYDAVFTFDSVHDQADPARMLKNIFKALKPDGTYFCQDIAGSSQLQNNIDHPVATLLYAISTTHCMSVSLAQNGAGLGTMWGKELATKMFEEAGFSSVECKELEHDFINYYYIVRK
ncbi:MAG: class I SAM-dependent methyltransferase [Candidatus Omnitrophica bacterium]|nr:class I SAM-dependent methyltransferase [Candidatus Omnitrophota bacterium]MCB9720177.1 class I SAM-dependent methyltransferase [Candidatus Omnitrophota bacterium]